MVDLDPRADRILAGVEMRQQELLTGLLDILHHVRRGIDPQVIAHEGDRPLLVDSDLLLVDDAGFECVFHIVSSMLGFRPKRATGSGRPRFNRSRS